MLLFIDDCLKWIVNTQHISSIKILQIGLCLSKPFIYIYIYTFHFINFVDILKLLLVYTYIKALE